MLRVFFRLQEPFEGTSVQLKVLEPFWECQKPLNGFVIIAISKSLKIQEHIISGYGGVYFGNVEEFLWDLEAFLDAGALLGSLHGGSSATTKGPNMLCCF